MARLYVAPKVEREDPNPVVREHCKIVGRFNVFGHEPGTTARIETTRSQLDVLIQAGLVEVIAAQAATQKAVVKHKKENGDGQAGTA